MKLSHVRANRTLIGLCPNRSIITISYHARDMWETFKKFLYFFETVVLSIPTSSPISRHPMSLIARSLIINLISASSMFCKNLSVLFLTRYSFLIFVSSSISSSAFSVAISATLSDVPDTKGIPVISCPFIILLLFNLANSSVIFRISIFM